MNRVRNLPVGDIWIHCSREASRCWRLIALCSFRGNDVLPFRGGEKYYVTLRCSVRGVAKILQKE